MKKLILCLAAAVVSLTAAADEGMWLLPYLQKMNIGDMKAKGCQLTAEDIYSVNHGSLKDAIVIFGNGCTGEVVSPEGLVFTNHHCGYGSIQALSSVEHDYLKDGFWAMSNEEELPAPGLTVTFIRRIIDVTPEVLGNIPSIAKGEERSEMEDKNIEALYEKLRAENPGMTINIQPFFGGNQYFAFVMEVYRDIRLVGTPPTSIGKFGGETDNWMWPRQTCDYSVFRIYADPKTNGPAAYSKDNVPYHPTQWAPVSLQGYEPGSFAMTIGYPGSTNRYLSSYGIQERRDIGNAIRIQSRAIKLGIMKKHMAMSEKTRIQYEDSYVGAANYYKNSIGMNHCIDSIGLISDKASFERKIQQWLASGASKDPYVNVDFDALKKAYADCAEPAHVLGYAQESFFGVSELFNRGLRLWTMRGMEVKGGNDPKKQYVEFEDNSDEWNLALDKELTTAMLKNYYEQVPQKYWPAFFKNTVQAKFNGDFARYTEWLYKKSELLKKGKKFMIKDMERVQQDPAVVAMNDIITVNNQIIGEYLPLKIAIQAQEKKLCEAKVQMEMDLPHYSDANFTMRLSYGQVGGFRMGNHDSGYYTDAASIVTKMDRAAEVEEYAAQPVMRELMTASDYGRYLDKKTGKMQLCFLTNNDITGGNSGSPIFNGKCQLIGLAFDGNWDSLASDINFDRQLARCIGVDVRYMLYLMDKWGHADRLLQEINPQ